jgi:myo-inositol 2-dehydrogenase/D-chiro-inositol 1-dehydrogenase
MPPRTSTRRQFLRSACGWTAAGAVAPYWLTGRGAQASESPSKNDRPNVGAIGVGGRGSADTKQASQFGDIVAVCDADLNHAEAAKAAYGGKPDVYQDYRKLLDRNDIDVIVNGTPDHWHTLVNIAALKAGKDVYAEKPLTLTVDEGKILRRVVDETGRIVQVGTQQRSDPPFQTAVELVRNGRIGRLRQVWVALPYFSTKGGPFPAEPVPPQLDWDLYQGQAPEHDYCRQRTHSVFRWWYEYAGGIVTDWGNHHVDIAHWGMDCELTGPTSVDARGIFPNGGKVDCYNTPDRFFARMRYPNGVELLYFSALNERLLYGEVEAHQATSPEKVDWLFGKEAPEEIKTFNRNGIMFIGDRGRVFVNRGGVYGKPFEELQANPLPGDAWRARPSRDHMANFFECVKTRQEPVSPVRIEHRTVTACHLTNISLRLGRPLTWDPKAEQIVGDQEANGWLSRKQRAPYVVQG